MIERKETRRKFLRKHTVVRVPKRWLKDWGFGGCDWAFTCNGHVDQNERRFTAGNVPLDPNQCGWSYAGLGEVPKVEAVRTMHYEGFGES